MAYPKTYCTFFTGFILLTYKVMSLKIRPASVPCTPTISPLNFATCSTFCFERTCFNMYEQKMSSLGLRHTQQQLSVSRSWNFNIRTFEYVYSFSTHRYLWIFQRDRSKSFKYHISQVYWDNKKYVYQNIYLLLAEVLSVCDKGLSKKILLDKKHHHCKKY